METIGIGIFVNIFSNIFGIAMKNIVINNTMTRLWFRKRKLLPEAYKLICKLIVGPTSNQNSSPGMPLAINRKEIWELVNSMAWLIVNAEINYKAHNIYDKIQNDKNYTDQDYKNDWHNELLKSYENDFELIKIWEYSEIQNYSIPILTKKRRVYNWIIQKFLNCKNTNWHWCFVMILLGYLIYNI